jgi:hypothetical protein
MRVRWEPRTVLLIFVLALHSRAQTVTCADSRSSTAPFPPIPTVIDNTCTVAPVNLMGLAEQSNFDLFGWLTFLALNWPADTSTCAADPSTSILSGKGPVVWQTYLQDTDIFVGSGQPAPWCNTSTTARTAFLARLPARVRALAQQHPEVHLFLHQDSKVSALLKSRATVTSSQIQGILQAVGGPLTDQNGRFVRYEIHVNQDEYNYLKNNNLWSLAGLKQYNQPINFPYQPGSYGQTGAIEIKAAWKVLCTTSSCKVQDDPTHFFTEQAIVYNDSTGSPSPGPNPVTVGLAGLHLTHKVAAQVTWVWATFQQVELTKSFFNNNCNYQCMPNTQTASTPYTELNANGTPINQPVQVVPYPTQDNNVAQYNKAFRNLLGTSVWNWYEQVSVQWTGETPPNPKPLILGNPLLETYIQGSSSCLACHSLSTVTTKQGNVSGDFSFLFIGAH